MHAKYHIACGTVLDLIFGTFGLMTLFSVLPDFPLLVNEYKLIKEKRRFRAEEVNEYIMRAYFLTHSVFVPILALLFHANYLWVLAYGIHIVCDWFTHTGVFAARPFYPVWHYRVKFGKEILK